MKDRHKPLLELECDVCGKRFKQHHAAQKYCSKECQRVRGREQIRAYHAKKRLERKRIVEMSRKHDVAKLVVSKEFGLDPISIAEVEYVAKHVPERYRWPIVKKWNARMTAYLRHLYLKQHEGDHE